MKKIENALKIEDGVLIECDYEFCGDLVIPESVTGIGRDAFCSCDSLPAETKQKIKSINEEACRIYYGKWL